MIFVDLQMKSFWNLKKEK